MQYPTRHDATAQAVESASVEPSAHNHDTAGRPAVIAIVPIFNERETMIAVLDTLERLHIVVVAIDDGSTDGSSALLAQWALAHPNARLLRLGTNHGKSAALRAACEVLSDDLARGAIDEDTIVLCVDADGQHDLAYLPALLEPLLARRADAVIARRDMNYHDRYKRTGNALMAALGSICAGTPLRDIESGYRAIRLRALLHAQQFYRGHRYSEAVEQAVVLSRLGYRVDNSCVVQVPVARSRTGLADVFSHVAAMCAAWFRVACWKNIEATRWSRLGLIAAAVMIFLFAGLLGAMLTHRVYLGNDSAQSYAHVWYLQEAIFSGRGIPLYMPSLESGRAFMFPYAAIPWLLAALLRPLLGDWVVTATMGAGTVLMLFAIRQWLPRLSPLLFAMMLVNPQLLLGVAQFQLPTVWAFAFACLSAASFDRAQPRRAGALAAAALITHPLAGAAAIAFTLLTTIERDHRLPLARAAALVLAALVASPAIWMFASTPLIGERSVSELMAPLVATAWRLSYLALPWLLQRMAPLSIRLHAPVLAASVLVVLYNLSILHPENPWDYTRPRFADFITAGLVTTNASYRVLTMTEREDGMVQLLQAGAVLAHEFFDESIQRRSFRTTEEYHCFLDLKHATHVLVSDEWLRRQYTNEVSMLDRLVDDGTATLTFRGADGTRAYTIKAATRGSCAHHAAAVGGITHGPRDHPLVALTFDDGLNGHHTEDIARILERHEVRGTFFVVGGTLEAQAPLARRLIAGGHVLGNHTQDHRRARQLDIAYGTLFDGQRTFRQTVDVCPRFFRPPWGTRTPFVDLAVRRAGMRSIFWDVEVADWAETDPARIAEHVLAAVQPGSIVLLHDGGDGSPGADRSATVAALPAILDGLQRRGLTPVGLDQLLGMPAYRERC